jgi:surfeit locus 1 family protein
VTERNHALVITRAGLIGSVLVLLIAIACVRLGFWQISRLRQRDARNALVTQRIELTPIPLEPAFGDTAGLLYRRVNVVGRYDHEHTIILPGRSLRGVPGAYVLTPILLRAGGTAVLVNRGWVPAADGFTVPLDSLRSPATDSVTALVLPFPGSGMRARNLPPLPDSGFRHAWFSPDPAAIRRQFPYQLLDVEVQALPDPAAPRFPIRLDPPTLDRGPHIGYAIQWFSFAVIGIGGWITLMLKKGEVRRPDELE